MSTCALIEAAISVGGEAKLELYAQIAELTDGAVTKPAQTQRILKWLAEHGCQLSNLQKSTVADALLRAGADRRRPGSCWSCGRAPEGPPP